MYKQVQTIFFRWKLTELGCRNLKALNILLNINKATLQI